MPIDVDDAQVAFFAEHGYLVLDRITTDDELAWLRARYDEFAAQRRTLTPFLVQLALNAAWTPLFFGLHRPGLAFLEIIFLWFAIVWTIASFWPVHRAAAGLLAPYLAWVSFAAVLNGTLWRLNA